MREAHSRPLCESESLFCRRQAWRLPLRGAPRATARRGTGRNQDVRRAHGGVVPRRSLSTLWRCLAGAVGPPPRPRSRRSPCSLVETSPRVASRASLLTIYASVFSGITPLPRYRYAASSPGAIDASLKQQQARRLDDRDREAARREPAGWLSALHVSV